MSDSPHNQDRGHFWDRLSDERNAAIEAELRSLRLADVQRQARRRPQRGRPTGPSLDELRRRLARSA